ncbi:hypothetical protein FisN_23Hh043 [Fistulifera solaris]|uniref:Uncharacterized protein n=1 Tax=Fistulifera solaris TaxID=1519565 RepID=A0A1Z5KNA3_FISSO|nr:hypothetical protein FisN_23Hh043 [Fistulifera solaris]|eukprot:GAX27491.1 hypothetical protein FisN_23Hh043 [Fistulifera solaris]
MTDNGTDLKPGQKFPTPTPGFGDRVFYETLLQQRPDSFMAQEWCVNYGVLSYERAEELCRQVQERKRRMRAGLPASPVKQEKPKKKKVKVVKEEAADVVVSGGDGIGRTTI